MGVRQDNSEYMRYSACFLVQDSTIDDVTKRRPIGTGFFVGVKEGPDYLASYVVTARHLVDGGTAKGPIFLRFNTVAGTFADLEVPKDEWITHPTTDVAIANVHLPKGIKASYIEPNKINRNTDIDLFDVSEGTVINTVAFFSQYYGKDTILPILRAGIISLMPHEKMKIKVGKDYYIETLAYLADTISISGHSGSPVFSPVNLRLVGIMQGHYELDQYSNYDTDNKPQVKGGTTTGISVVIPAQAIHDLLEMPVVAEQRRLLKAQYLKDKMNSLDDVPPQS